MYSTFKLVLMSICRVLKCLQAMRRKCPIKQECEQLLYRQEVRFLLLMAINVPREYSQNHSALCHLLTVF